ncbi:hypothetical protein niasHT_029607 [Heterodera trifolii]|uniref:Uncharacterized protein n=1 Tax=Heterodera trifolii TaxID=157864 RepID=A0ABD2JKW7_9BILA
MRCKMAKDGISAGGRHWRGIKVQTKQPKSGTNIHLPPISATFKMSLLIICQKVTFFGEFAGFWLLELDMLPSMNAVPPSSQRQKNVKLYIHRSAQYTMEAWLPNQRIRLKLIPLIPKWQLFGCHHLHRCQLISNLRPVSLIANSTALTFPPRHKATRKI